MTVMLLPGSEALEAAIASHRRKKEFVKTAELSRTELTRKIHRYISPPSSLSRRPVMAPYWEGAEGMRDFFDWARELYRTEYRDGFNLTWRLGTDNVNYSSKETVCWAPSILIRMLSRNELKRQVDSTVDLPKGIVKFEPGKYGYRKLDRTLVCSGDPFKLHQQYLTERRDYMLEISLSDIGPQLKGLLDKRIARLNDAIEHGKILDFI